MSTPHEDRLSAALGRTMGRRVLIGGIGAGALAVLGACTTGATTDKESQSASDTSAQPAPEAVISAAIAGAALSAGQIDVAVTGALTVSATDGELQTVTVADASGVPIAGEIDATKTLWTATAPLAYASTYTVAATATNADSKDTDYTVKFSTVSPSAEIFPSIGPLDGTVAGVAMPVRVFFDSPVTDRKAFQQAMVVTSNPPQNGAWSWFSDSEVHWRPEVYWKAGTTVQVDVNIYGIAAGNGAYGQENRTISFSIGNDQVSKCDTTTHQLHCYAGGQLVKSIPIAAGLEVPGRYTKSGVHVVMEKREKMTMDSTTYGLALDAGGYQTEVFWATRISNNGEFVHAAPWSLADQGVRNVSHGCINASPDNAQWFQQWAQIGDPCEITGTPVPLTIDDGDIFDWTVPWDQWLAGSAI